MKTNHKFLCGLAALSLLTTGAFAQTVVRQTTTTNAAGTISEFGPESIVIRSESAPQPVRYVSRSTTTYVDETGAPVSIETVKSGLPVTVHYVEEGGQMVASRVVVRRAAPMPAPTVIERQTTTVAPVPAPVIIEKKTTTTTTTGPAK